MKKQKLIKYLVGAEIGIISLLLIGWECYIPQKISSFFDGVKIDKSQSVIAKADYIKWVDFQITCTALEDAYQYDVESYGTEKHIDWITLLAYLACRYGGNFKSYKANDMKVAVDELSDEAGKSKLSEMKYYQYYHEAYEAVLGGMVGEYELENETSGNERTENITTEKAEGTSKKYGMKAYSPIAKGFPYSHFDDFGTSRSYGYQRQHLGHDMLGQVGTPIIAIESGYVAALGWNQYGGWRIGINSFDGKRYYYYAHLRQNRPYAEGLELGNVVTAGDVIGYMGRTGYSATENVNNIQVTHLHWGLQLIFDESQREGNHEIWVDVYPLTQFLSRHQSEAVRNDETKEWTRKEKIVDPEVEKYKKNQKQTKK